MFVNTELECNVNKTIKRNHHVHKEQFILEDKSLVNNRI